MIAHSCWFGSGFIYARLNLNLYMEIAEQKKTEREKTRLKFGASETDAVPEMLMPFLF